MHLALHLKIPKRATIGMQKSIESLKYVALLNLNVILKYN